MTRRALATSAAVLLALVMPGAAHAARGQQTIMEDDTQILGEGPDARNAALDQFKALGTDVVKVRVQWRDYAPDPSSRRRPDFDATDPAAYPTGVWDDLDAAVAGIVARGMKPFLMVGPPAPDWATGGPTKKYVGAWKPDPAEYGQFAQAIGRRYSGANEGLPRVSMWSIWNEPNHPQFIQPLSERLGGHMVPTAADQYRRLYIAGYNALAAAGHASDTVLFGEVLPIGQNRLGTLNTIHPILWLREFFCVDSNYRPFRGSAATARGCDNFTPITTSGFAMHPYSKPVGLRYHLASPDDATIGQISRVEKALDLIARTHRVRKRLPIYSTEFGIQTDPPDCIGSGAPLGKQAAIINEAEYDSYVHSRVKTYSQYLLIDDPVLTQFDPGSNERYGRYQTGLEWGENAVRCESPGVHFKYAAPKHPTYDAFQTPLYVRKLPSGHGVQVFGRARPRGFTPQAIQILHSGRVVRTISAKRYFLTTIRGSTGGTWQLQWTLNNVTAQSRVATATADPPASAR